MKKDQMFILVIVGFLLVAITLIFYVITYKSVDINNVYLADKLCNSQIEILGNEIDIGQIGQSVFDLSRDCSKVHMIKLGLNYLWIVGVIGMILWFIAIFSMAGLDKK